MTSEVSNSLPRVNRVLLGDTIAILVCPAPNGKQFAVTIDLDDLPRVQAAGFWRVANFRKWLGQVGLYCYTVKSSKNIYLHRFIAGAIKGQGVDHRFNRRLDNRKSELRCCSQSLNMVNRQYGGHGKSGLRGVRVRKSGRYMAVVGINKGRKYLGTYDTPEQAAERVRDFLISQGAEYATGRQK